MVDSPSKELSASAGHWGADTWGAVPADDLLRLAMRLNGFRSPPYRAWNDDEDVPAVRRAAQEAIRYGNTCIESGLNSVKHAQRQIVKAETLLGLLDDYERARKGGGR